MGPVNVGRFERLAPDFRSEVRGTLRLAQVFAAIPRDGRPATPHLVAIGATA